VLETGKELKDAVKWSGILPFWNMLIEPNMLCCVAALCFPAGSILQIEPKYFGEISMIAPAGSLHD
jgi:hypothetical protein